MKVDTVTNNVGCQRDLAQFDARRLRSHCQRCTRRHTLVEENFEEELMCFVHEGDSLPSFSRKHHPSEDRMTRLTHVESE